VTHENPEGAGVARQARVNEPLIVVRCDHR
jgi:hypothetical protein